MTVTFISPKISRDLKKIILHICYVHRVRYEIFPREVTMIMKNNRQGMYMPTDQENR